jgi:hypothetical protein
MSQDKDACFSPFPFQRFAPEERKVVDVQHAEHALGHLLVGPRLNDKARVHRRLAQHRPAQQEKKKGGGGGGGWKEVSKTITQRTQTKNKKEKMMMRTWMK